MELRPKLVSFSAIFVALKMSQNTQVILIYVYKSSLLLSFFNTRSYAALRAADLDWIVRPGYSLGRVHSGEKP